MILRPISMPYWPEQVHQLDKQIQQLRDEESVLSLLRSANPLKDYFISYGRDENDTYHLRVYTDC